MSRYTGPRVHKARALNTELPGLTAKSFERRPYPPGQHGPELGKRRKESDYRKQLVEKQKIRFNYGLGETQLRRLVKEARKSQQAPDVALLALIERRLDNVVFRAGFAPTIPAARQLIVHGHVNVDGKRVDRPSYRIRTGQEIALRESATKASEHFWGGRTPKYPLPSWLSITEGEKKARITTLPTRDEILLTLQPSLVIEYYAKRL